ncbi:hypothetical protein AB3M80_02535 [Arthrospira platensis BEA 1257B]
MNLKKAKIIRDRLLSMLKPGFQLSDIQEQVFCESWEKRSYREIATRLGYEHDYIRQIGAQLWKMLSKATGKTVTKRNLHTVLQEEYCRWAGSPPISNLLARLGGSDECFSVLGTGGGVGKVKTVGFERSLFFGGNSWFWGGG